MMNVKNLSSLLISISMMGLLSGCTFWNSPEPVVVKKVAEAKTKLNIKDLEPVTPRRIKWFIITEENSNEIFADLEKKKYDPVLFGLTDDDYENLSMNLVELRKYIIQQKEIIKAYKDYYESEDNITKE